MSVDTREPVPDDREIGPQTRNGHLIPDWHYSRVTGPRSGSGMPNYWWAYRRRAIGDAVSGWRP